MKKREILKVIFFAIMILVLVMPYMVLAGPIFDESEPRVITNSLYCTGFAVGDVDGDDDYDLVTVHNFRYDSLRLNNGQGYFNHNLLGGAYCRPGPTILIDYDRDDDLDIFIAGCLVDGVYGVFWYVNDGYSNFEINVGIERWSKAIDMGDLNGDDFPDIVIGGLANNAVAPSAVYLNDQAGGFSLTQELSPQYNGQYGIALGDVDGDNDLDCAVADELWLNDGSGYFVDSGQDLKVSDTYRTWGREFADIDNDNDLDLLVGEIDYGCYVLLNDGNGVFTWTGERLATAFNLAVADINSDGSLDVATSGVGNGTFASIFLGNGTGQFGASVQTFPVGDCCNCDVGFADVDGDLLKDLILSCATVENNGHPAAFINITASTIPTLSEWGMIIFMALMMGIGVLILYRRRMALDSCYI